MSRKTIVLATLALFPVISWSCYSWKKTPVQSVLSAKLETRTKLKISAAQAKSGEVAEFNRHPAAKIQGDSIVGMRIVKNFTLEKVKIKLPLSLKTGVGYRIVTADGDVYKTDRIISQDASIVTFDFYFPASIPLADVDSVWIRKGDELRFFALIVAIPVGIYLGLLLLLKPGD